MTTATMTETTSDVGLKSRALKVTIHVHAWTNRRVTKQAQQVLADKFKVKDATRTKTHKELIDPKEIKAVETALSAVYDDHVRRTLPWLDGGTRILSSTGYMDYQAAQRKLQAKVDIEVSRLAAKWDSLVEQSMNDLGELGVRADFPTADELTERYSIDRNMEALSDAGDVRLAVGEDEVLRIRQHIADGHARAMKGMTEDIVRRIKEVAERAATRLASYKPAEHGKRAESDFRDTLVTNARELVDLLPSLNIMRDCRIDRIRLDLMQVARYNASDLKADPIIRKQTADAAAEILKKMEDFI